MDRTSTTIDGKSTLENLWLYGKMCGGQDEKKNMGPHAMRGWMWAMDHSLESPALCWYGVVCVYICIYVLLLYM